MGAFALWCLGQAVMAEVIEELRHDPEFIAAMGRWDADQQNQ